MPVYAVKEYKMFGKYPVTIWIDDEEMEGWMEIESYVGIRYKPLSRKTVKKYVKAIREGKIKPIEDCDELESEQCS